jgi:hypothetical protein
MQEDLLTEEVLNPTNPALEKIQNFTGTYPKQLWALAFTEMWERFCFYGMRGVLTFFMIDKLFLSDEKANLQYGAIQAFVYAFTFIGGILADKILGFKKSLLFGGLIMILGNLIIAFSPTDFFYIGIVFSIIGTGFFKPNISSMVGELYTKSDNRRDAGYGLFYVNVTAQETPGLVWINSFGDIIKQTLNQNDKISIDNGVLLGYDSTINMHTSTVGGIKSTLFSGEGLITEIINKNINPITIYLQGRSNSAYMEYICSKCKHSSHGGNISVSDMILSGGKKKRNYNKKNTKNTNKK